MLADEYSTVICKDWLPTVLQNLFFITAVAESTLLDTKMRGTEGETSPEDLPVPVRVPGKRREQLVPISSVQIFKSGRAELLRAMGRGTVGVRYSTYR